MTLSSRLRGGDGSESEEGSHLRRNCLAALLPDCGAAAGSPTGDQYPGLAAYRSRGTDHVRAFAVLR